MFFFFVTGRIHLCNWKNKRHVTLIYSVPMTLFHPSSIEMIITATGDNVPPVPIESLIKENAPIISNVILVGDQREYLVCLITLKVRNINVHALVLTFEL